MISSSAIDTFEAHRSQLIGLAYRITGSRFEAEDIAQETFIKWLNAEHKTINSAHAWLMKVATRMSLDYLKSARVQRVSYIGPWLPEPFIIEHSATEEGPGFGAKDNSPDQELELDESISMAMLVLLEQLSPAERAVFILHDLFHFSFDDIAEILERTGSSCRKLASRAREKISTDAMQHKHNKDEHIRMLKVFFNAIKDGDMAGLVSMLKENVTFHSDGGGKAVALLEVLHGSNSVAAFLMDKLWADFNLVESGEVTIKMTWFNGSPGLVVWNNDMQPITAFNFELEDGIIRRIHALRNPDKLRLFGGS